MLTILTFNLRCPAKMDGVNYSPLRMPRVMEKIREEKPDVIGFQELEDTALSTLREGLPEYEFIGAGRDRDYRGESCRLAYRRETVEVHAMGHFWLSPTPEVPGSRYEEQSGCPRVCTWAMLMHRISGQRFAVVNTHLDHVHEKARTLGLNQVLAEADRIRRETGVPVFVTGDFNFPPEEGTYGLIGQFGFEDLTRDVAPTFHGFGTVDPVRVDYILAGQPGKYAISRWHECNGGVYLSDHDPVMLSWDNESTEAAHPGA